MSNSQSFAHFFVFVCLYIARICAVGFAFQLFFVVGTELGKKTAEACMNEKEEADERRQREDRRVVQSRRRKKGKLAGMRAGQTKRRRKKKKIAAKRRACAMKDAAIAMS
jgi:hypothetical protein